MKLLLITDIFGDNSQLQQWLSLHLQTSSAPVEVISPYDKQYNFKGEDEAYKSYSSLCGHDGYLNQVLSAIERQREAFCILSFSSGALAAYRALAMQNNLELLEKAIFVYPIDLLNHFEEHWPYSTEIFLANSERHYDVKEAKLMLDRIANINTEVLSAEHGFMNSNSDHFDQAAMLQLTGRLKEILPG